MYPPAIYTTMMKQTSDHPGVKLVISRRGRNHMERKTHHSKSSVSVMFAGDTAGEFLPPMAAYELKSIYKKWLRGGPVNSVYNCMKNGWFDSQVLECGFSNSFYHQWAF